MASRAELEGKLIGAARGLAPLVERAAREVEQGTACSSWFFGSDSGCDGQRGAINKLRARAAELPERVRVVVEQPDVSRHQLQTLGDYISACIDEAAYMIHEADLKPWATLIVQTLREFAELVGEAVSIVIDTVIDVGTGIAGGVVKNLSPWAWLVIGVTAYMYFGGGKVGRA